MEAVSFADGTWRPRDRHQMTTDVLGKKKAPEVGPGPIVDE
jgi:hypothetical protein